MNGHLLQDHAIEKANQGPTWEIFSMKCQPLGSDVTHYFEIRGAVCPKVTRGKRRGKPNFHAHDRATRKTVFITPKEQDEWEAQWSLKTGNCAHCQGEGKVITKVSVAGTTYRDCCQCNGTGKAKP